MRSCIAAVLAVLVLCSEAALPLTGVNLAGAEFGEGTIPGTAGTNYIYPTTTEYTYWAGKGANAIRLPFQWGRLQLTANATFDATQQSYLTYAVKNITSRGMAAIIEPHNYGRYPYSTSSSPIGSSGAATIANFANFWTKLATLFKDNDLVVFELMNEPHTMSTATWYKAAQAAINAIRATGATNLILTPGNCWTPVWRFTSDTSCDSDGTYTNSAGFDALVSDPLDNMMVDVHQYLDSAYSGTDSACTHNVSVFTAFTAWARSTGRKAMLTEIGTGTSSTCQSYLETILTYMESNSDVWYGWTWWAAGSWWGSTFYSLEPSGSTDATQTAWLTPHFRGETVIPGTSSSSTSAAGKTTVSSSPAVVESSSPAAVVESSSPATVAESSSPATVTESSSPATVAESSSPAVETVSSAPISHVESSSPATGVQSSSPIVVVSSDDDGTASTTSTCSLSSSLPTGAASWGTCSTTVSSGNTCSYTCSTGYSAVAGECTDSGWSTSPSCSLTTGAAGALEVSIALLLAAFALL